MKTRFPFGATPGQAVIFAAVAAVVAASAISAKTHRAVAPLAMVETPVQAAPQPEPLPVSEIIEAEPTVEGVRYFNGRPVRPVRTVWMTVTAYSPDHRSCGEHADGITASANSIWTNGMRLVAADTGVMPMGTMLSIPGYDAGRVVPVLDRGGAIKGDRLDVLFPSHNEALRWGVQRVPVTVWDYAD
ncbi:MAG: hypothetical protein D6693_03170 [Planctomycetota bacterium]|nr:MAG: hypothetical protein D6693_03170 [Planctomycetota bacterium]